MRIASSSSFVFYHAFAYGLLPAWGLPTFYPPFSESISTCRLRSRHDHDHHHTTPVTLTAPATKTTTPRQSPRPRSPRQVSRLRPPLPHHDSYPDHRHDHNHSTIVTSTTTTATTTPRQSPRPWPRLRSPPHHGSHPPLPLPPYHDGHHDHDHDVTTPRQLPDHYHHNNTTVTPTTTTTTTVAATVCHTSKRSLKGDSAELREDEIMGTLNCSDAASPSQPATSTTFTGRHATHGGILGS